MRQMKAKVDRDLAALNRVSLAARVCFARAKNPSGSKTAFSKYLTTPNGNVVTVADYGRVIASATNLRSDLDYIAKEWKRFERREFESENLFWFGGVAGIIFMVWAWVQMISQSFALGSIAYFFFMGIMFSTHFRQRMVQRRERFDLINKKWHEHDIAGMIAALRSGDKRWSYEPKLDYSVTTPII